MKKIFILVSCFISVVYCASAQTEGNGYMAKIDTVHKSGYYNIALSKEMTLLLKTDYSDLRIVNNDKAIPFRLNPESDVMRETYLRKMKFTIGQNDKDKTVIYASADAFVNITYNLLLTLETIAAERKCSVSGSNDQQHWTTIRDNVQMYPFPGLTKSTGEIRVGFPQSSYQYFRLTIDNEQMEPYQINGVCSSVSEEGYSPEFFQEVRMVQNPAVRITQKDSGSITYLKVRQPENYHFDRICYQLSGGKYFNRKAEVYLPVDGVQSSAFPGKKYAAFSIIDNASFNAKIPVSNARDFMIVVYNEKDTPFKFNGVTTSLNQRFITAYLDSGKEYQLILGNSGIEQSSATKISDSISPATLPFLQTGKITEMKAVAKKQTVASSNWLQWLLVLAGVAVLAFIGYKFFANTNKAKQHDHL